MRGAPPWHLASLLNVKPTVFPVSSTKTLVIVLSSSSAAGVAIIALLLAVQLVENGPVQHGVPVGAFNTPEKVPEAWEAELKVPAKVKLYEPGVDVVYEIVNELPEIDKPDNVALSFVTVQQEKTKSCATSKDIILLLVTVNFIVPALVLPVQDPS